MDFNLYYTGKKTGRSAQICLQISLIQVRQSEYHLSVALENR